MEARVKPAHDESNDGEMLLQCRLANHTEIGSREPYGIDRPDKNP